jgi:hypothetical protein
MAAFIPTGDSLKAFYQSTSINHYFIAAELLIANKELLPDGRPAFPVALIKNH